MTVENTGSLWILNENGKFNLLGTFKLMLLSEYEEFISITVLKEITDIQNERFIFVKITNPDPFIAIKIEGLIKINYIKSLNLHVLETSYLSDFDW